MYLNVVICSSCCHNEVHQRLVGRHSVSFGNNMLRQVVCSSWKTPVKRSQCPFGQASCLLGPVGEPFPVPFKRKKKFNDYADGLLDFFCAVMAQFGQLFPSARKELQE